MRPLSETTLSHTMLLTLTAHRILSTINMAGIRTFFKMTIKKYQCLCPSEKKGQKQTHFPETGCLWVA